ncbi:hypothetical protein OB08_12255 [Microbacterium sp. HJ5]
MEELIRRTSEVFRSQHRPDLDAQMRTLLEVAYRKMKQARVFALYLQTSARDVPLPMSITASTVSGQLGGTLDRQVARLVRENGAQFLTDDRSILRWEAAVGSRAEADGAAAHVVDYLIPIPGSERRSALQFTTTIPLPADHGPELAPLIDGLTQLSDLLISTFTWDRSAQ